MRRLLTLVITLVILCATSTEAASSRRRTTRRGLKAIAVQQARANMYDTIATDTVTIILSGYDKPRRSTRESLFALNAGADTIHGLILNITYRDTRGNMLHRRRVPVTGTIPPGQRRMLHFKSWDTQQAFYYIKSAPYRPHTAATPYAVTITPDSALITRRATTVVF